MTRILGVLGIAAIGVAFWIGLYSVARAAWPHSIEMTWSLDCGVERASVVVSGAGAFTLHVYEDRDGPPFEQEYYWAFDGQAPAKIVWTTEPGWKYKIVFEQKKVILDESHWFGCD